MKIKIKPAYNDSDEIKKLFLEYTDMLVKDDPDFAKYLEVQHYHIELEQLEVKYGMPYGRLYIVKADDKTAGCIGLRKIDEDNCEMKRLYIKSVLHETISY